MLKKIILSVLMVSAVLSGTVFATPTPPTPQALKNGSSNYSGSRNSDHFQGVVKI